MTLNFRTLTAREIECRIQQVKEKGLILLLYKDARCDQNILDETVGPMNWEKRYDLIDGQLFCTISIWDDDKNMWIRRQDVGVESNTEAEKGRASDAQKRAASAFGVGRELYTSPFIWIPANQCKITGTKCYDKFSVAAIEYNEFREISHLVIINETSGNVCYTYGSSAEEKSRRAKPESTKQAPAPQTMAPQDALETVRAITAGITDVDSANKALETIVAMALPQSMSREVNQLLTVATSAIGLTYSKSAKGYVRK